MINKTFIYGLAGADQNYRPMKYFCIDLSNLTDYRRVSDLRDMARLLVAECPNIKYVYMIDNRAGLYETFKDSAYRGGVENGVVFKDMLERYGVSIPTY